MKNKIKTLNIATNKKDIGTFKIYIMLPVGAIHESKKESGVSHVLEHILFKNKRNLEVVKRLAKVGGRYNAMTYFDYTCFFIKTTNEHAEEAMSILRDMVCKTTFSERDLEMERGVLLEEYHGSITDPNVIDGVGMFALLDTKNPYNKAIIGSRSVIKNIKAVDLKRYHKQHYAAPIVFIKCDAAKANKYTQIAQNIFGPIKAIDMWNDSELAEKATMIAPKIAVLYSPRPQYLTKLTWPAYRAGDFKKCVTLQFVNHCLSGTLIYSLLNIPLRVQRSLVYTAMSTYEYFAYTGLCSIILKTSNNNTDYVIGLVLDVLEKLKRNGLGGSLKVLDYYQKSYINMMHSMISNDAHIQDIALATLYGGFSGDYVKNKMNVIKRITQNDIKAVCREVFDYTKMGLISIGDYVNVNDTSNKITNMVDSYYGRRL